MLNKRKTREELKRERSMRASRAANARWERYHAEIPRPDYGELPDDLFRITVEHVPTGTSHVLMFHPGTRANNYRIDVDGRPWKVAGWTGAIDALRRSCNRMTAR